MTARISKEPEKSSQPIVVVVLAYHHDSGNIASLRFSGWIKYMDPERYKIHVISSHTHHTPSGKLPIPCATRSGPLSWLDLALAAFTPGLYNRLSNPKRTWLAGAVAHSSEIIRVARKNGQHSLVIASYSPLHALIVARYLCWSFGIHYWADFRDGLTFEGSGRRGKAAAFVRRLVERAALRPSFVISGVSEPICSYYAERYPQAHVELLPNGFDPILMRVQREVATTDQSFSLGHFGRISLSDATRFGALQEYVETIGFLTRNHNIAASSTFVGELTGPEAELVLSASQSNCTVHQPVARVRAHEMMNQMDALVLLTGDLTGTATGKIFEYLATGKRIVLFSLVENEAIRILRSIGDDDFIHVKGHTPKTEVASALAACLARPFKRSFDKISPYDKSLQAKKIQSLIDTYCR